MVFAKVLSNQVNRAMEVEQLSSGKGINCARVIMNLRQPVVALLFVGGESGAWLRRAVQAEGIATSEVDVPQPTRTCCTILETGSGAATELVENAAPVDMDAVHAYLAEYRRLLERCRVVVCAGTLPPGVPVTLYREMLQMAVDRGVCTLLDAQGESLFSALPARPFLVKPNRMELAAATGIDCNTEAGCLQAIKALHREGARWVMVTDGGGEALLSGNNQTWSYIPPAIEPRNPIGSGDSTMGGIAVSLMLGKQVPEAVHFGVACGTANAMGVGYGRLDVSMVSSLLDQVVVR